MDNGISVIICCYNSARNISNTLKHLARQELLPQLSCEIILVNNGSSDNTESVAIQTWSELNTPFPLLILQQKKPGKSFALSLAVQHVKYSCTIICDDDNWLFPNYFITAYEVLSTHPEYGIVGGQSIAIANDELPYWFYDVQYAYACGAPASQSMDFTGKGYFWGAGMVINTVLARLIMHPDCPTLLTGRRGNLLTAGEDDEKCVRAWLAGYKTYYDDRLLLHHFMPETRLTISYKNELLKGFEEQGPIINAYRRLYSILNLNRVQKVNLFFLQWLAFLKGKVLFNKNACLIAADFLYFITRWEIWSTRANKNAMQFYLYLKIVQGIKSN